MIISHHVFSPQDDCRSVVWAPVWKDRILSLTVVVLCLYFCIYGKCLSNGFIAFDNEIGLYKRIKGFLEIALRYSKQTWILHEASCFNLSVR